MKGLILCGGLGTRLWPITLSLPKQLIPLAGKPVLCYIIDSLIKAKIKEIGIVVGNNEEEFRSVLDREYSHRDVEIKYIYQEKPLGLAHAVMISEDFIDNEGFIMILGDNYYELNILKVIDNFYDSDSNCHILLKEVEEPERFGIAKIENGTIKDVVEKPKNPPSNLAITGIYVFDKNIFRACKEISPSWRGEYEITDAIKRILDDGYKVTYDVIDGIWKDLGKVDDILEINRYELTNLKNDIKGSIDNSSEILGKLTLGKGSRIINSVIKGPVYIGTNTTVENSIIGPYTTIYNNANILSSTLENTIVLDNCKIINVDSKIASSIIERDCIIEKSKIEGSENQLILGRKTKIILGKDKGE